jgi:hypothetical protein
MPGRNGQRKPGTTRGSPRRSRTAKASRISRHAVKSRCARGWGGWGRLSDDGSRQHNSDTSEDPWGGGLPHLHGGALSRPQPDTVRDCCGAVRCAKGGRKPNISRCMPGAGLSRSMFGKVPPYRPALQPYRGKPAVRNDRGDRGNVGIIRSPVRASIPPDCGGRLATAVPTANDGPPRTMPLGRGPSSESLQGRKPRWGERVAVPRSLWGFDCVGRGFGVRTTRLIAPVDDVGAYEWRVVEASVGVEGQISVSRLRVAWPV